MAGHDEENTKFEIPWWYRTALAMVNPVAGLTVGKSPRQLGDLGSYALQEGMLGYGDEVSAFVQALTDSYAAKQDPDTGLLPTLAIPNYDSYLEQFRKRSRRYQDEYPVESALVGLAAGTAPMLPVAAVTGPAGAGALRLAGRTATQGGLGALIAGAQGFGEGKGLQNRLHEAANGAVFGGALGALFPIVGSALGKVRSDYRTAKSPWLWGD